MSGKHRTTTPTRFRVYLLFGLLVIGALYASPLLPNLGAA